MSKQNLDPGETKLVAELRSKGVPRPQVRANQAFLVVSVVAAVATGWYWLLALPVAAGLAGILFGKNPVVLIAGQFLRQSLSHYVFEDKLDLRFNQILATGMLAVSMVAGLAGWNTLALVFAGMVFVAAGVALGGFCVGCWLRFQINAKLHQWRNARLAPAQ